MDGERIMPKNTHNFCLINFDLPLSKYNERSERVTLFIFCSNNIASHQMTNVWTFAQHWFHINLYFYSFLFRTFSLSISFSFSPRAVFRSSRAVIHQLGGMLIYYCCCSVLSPTRLILIVCISMRESVSWFYLRCCYYFCFSHGLNQMLRAHTSAKALTLTCTSINLYLNK